MLKIKLNFVYNFDMPGGKIENGGTEIQISAIDIISLLDEESFN